MLSVLIPLSMALGHILPNAGNIHSKISTAKACVVLYVIYACPSNTIAAWGHPNVQARNAQRLKPRATVAKPPFGGLLVTPLDTPIVLPEINLSPRRRASLFVARGFIRRAFLRDRSEAVPACPKLFFSKVKSWVFTIASRLKSALESYPGSPLSLAKCGFEQSEVLGVVDVVVVTVSCLHQPKLHIVSACHQHHSTGVTQVDRSLETPVV